jgi:hypothetical protein
MLGPTYTYPTYFNIKILVRDWCVPHQVICLVEKVFMCHTCTGICIIYCVCIYILLHILTSKYWLETGVSLTKWFLLSKKVFMWHICIFNIRIIRENNFRSKICISKYWLETGVSLTKWFVLRKKFSCVIHVQVYVLSMYIHVYPTTYFNIKILVRDWCVPHQVIFVKEKRFHVAYMYILLTQLNIRIIRGCVC